MGGNEAISEEITDHSLNRSKEHKLIIVEHENKEMKKKLERLEALNNSSLIEKVNATRVRRGLKGVGKTVVEGVKIIAYGLSTLFGGIGASEYYIQRIQQQQQRSATENTKFECEVQKFGCFEGYCWSHCGPRPKSDDWCFVTSNNNNNNNFTMASISNGTLFIPYLKCVTPSECDPCLQCAGVCTQENITP